MAIIRLFAAAALVFSLAGCMSVQQGHHQRPPLHPVTAPQALPSPPSQPGILRKLARAYVHKVSQQSLASYEAFPIPNPYCNVPTYAASNVKGHGLFYNIKNFLFQTDDDEFIVVDKDLSTSLLHFTLAHECGHYFIKISKMKFDNSVEEEVAADATAIEILKQARQQNVILAAAIFFASMIGDGGTTHPHPLIRANYLLKSLAE